MRLFLTGILLASTPAFAQQSYSIVLPEAGLNLVGKALGKMPYEEVAPLMQAIQAQVNQQQAAEADKQKAALKAQLEKEKPAEKPKE